MAGGYLLVSGHWSNSLRWCGSSHFLLIRIQPFFADPDPAFRYDIDQTRLYRGQNFSYILVVCHWCWCWRRVFDLL